MSKIILCLLVFLKLSYGMKDEGGINNKNTKIRFQECVTTKCFELENDKIPYLVINFIKGMSLRSLEMILSEHMQTSETYIAIVRDEKGHLRHTKLIEKNKNTSHKWIINKLENDLYFLYKTGRDYISFESEGSSLGEVGNDSEELENLEKNNITNKKVIDIKNDDVISSVDMARNGSLLIQEKRGYGENKANFGDKNIFDEKDIDEITKKGKFTLSAKYQEQGEIYTINENYQPDIDELKETPHIKKQIYLRVREDDPAKRCLFNLFATNNVNGDELLQLIKKKLPHISLILAFDAFIKDQKDEQALKVGHITVSMRENYGYLMSIYFDENNVENKGYGLSSLNLLLKFFEINPQLFPFVKKMGID